MEVGFHTVCSFILFNQSDYIMTNSFKHPYLAPVSFFVLINMGHTAHLLSDNQTFFVECINTCVIAT